MEHLKLDREGMTTDVPCSSDPFDTEARRKSTSCCEIWGQVRIASVAALPGL